MMRELIKRMRTAPGLLHGVTAERPPAIDFSELAKSVAVSDVAAQLLLAHTALITGVKVIEKIILTPEERRTRRRRKLCRWSLVGARLKIWKAWRGRGRLQPWMQRRL